MKKKVEVRVTHKYVVVNWEILRGCQNLSESFRNIWTVPWERKKSGNLNSIIGPIKLGGLPQRRFVRIVCGSQLQASRINIQLM